MTEERVMLCEFCGRDLGAAERNGEDLHCFNCWQPFMGPYMKKRKEAMDAAEVMGDEVYPEPEIKECRRAWAAQLAGPQAEPVKVALLVAADRIAALEAAVANVDIDIAEARREALEEAARLVERNWGTISVSAAGTELPSWPGMTSQLAAAIRALKDKTDDRS